ncbi:MAG: hypothetical protein ACRELD_10840 [Longimicrobiales bacterium]
MISKDDLRRILRHERGEKPVFSLFLDMSVNSDNKRTYTIFLSQQRSLFAGEGGARNGYLAEDLDAALTAVERWIDHEFDEANKSVAAFGELGGGWLEVLQFPAHLINGLSVGDHPKVGPLVHLLNRYHRYGVLLVDREHLRMLNVSMGRSLHEHQVETDPYPTPHDIKRGGYSAPDFQKRKAEEVKHFFREFAKEVDQFDRRYAPDHFVILGTDENVKHFTDYLAEALKSRIIHTGHAPIDASGAEVLERLEPLFREWDVRQEAAAVELLRDRVGQHHFATSGFSETLQRLQEGKVETLVVARNVERTGARCVQCGFYIEAVHAHCPYCGGQTRDGVELVETMIRLAAEQDARVEFTDASALRDLDGVGALLRF